MMPGQRLEPEPPHGREGRVNWRLVKGGEIMYHLGRSSAEVTAFAKELYRLSPSIRNDRT